MSLAMSLTGRAKACQGDPVGSTDDRTPPPPHIHTQLGILMKSGWVLHQRGGTQVKGTVRPWAQIADALDAAGVPSSRRWPRCAAAWQVAI